MNRKLLVGLFWVALAFHSPLLNGQGLMAIADKQYELEAYNLAIDNYRKVLAGDPSNSDAMFKLAESYRLSNKDNEALNLYDQLTTLEKFDPLAYLNYGLILKSTGELDKAKFWFYKYMEFDQKIGKHYAESCEKAKILLGEDEHYEISLFTGNSASSDFGASFDGKNMIYSSFRNDLKRDADSKNKSLIHIQGNQLFSLEEAIEKQSHNIEFLRGELKSSYHIGPVDYSDQNGSLVVYTKNNFKNGVKFVRSNDTHMSLFFAEKDQNSDFNKERPFPYNETGFSTGFGYLANKGETLYFASNRPGGYGGYDLYVSYLRNGSWSIPVNLGDSVNSPGNEITPFFDDQNEKLYFSSDYHFGLGGFDIFISEKTGDLTYSSAINIGKGINSLSDDYYFVISPNSGKYYFTSNRLGGKGLDDIYYATPAEVSNDMAIETSMPPAIDLNDFVIEGSNNKNGNAALASEEDMGFSLPVIDNNFSMVDARLVAKQEVILEAPPTKVYFIQVAALANSRGNVSTFDRLTSYGNLYKVYKSNSTKIRLGYYYDRDEATKILSSVKSMGYNDAFIVHESLVTSELELVGNSSSSNAKGSISSTYTPAPEVTNYKIRLASYTDPLWFDVSRVNDLGEIEQWTKGQYTIFILSGYGSLDNAEKAMVKAKNRGFTDAHIVIDNNGYLEKLKQN